MQRRGDDHRVRHSIDRDAPAVIEIRPFGEGRAPIEDPTLMPIHPFAMTVEKLVCHSLGRAGRQDDHRLARIGDRQSRPTGARRPSNPIAVLI